MSSEIGEKLGENSRVFVNSSVYFLVGICFIGTISAIYLFFRGFRNGWKKVGKIKA